MSSPTARRANAEASPADSSDALHALILRLVAASVDGQLEQGLIELTPPERSSAFASLVGEALNGSVQASPESADEYPIVDSSLQRVGQSQIAQCIRDAQESNLIDPLLDPAAVEYFLRTLGLGISLLASANPESEIIGDSRWSAVWERVLESLQPPAYFVST